jgi:hypothetical protein
MLCTFYLMIYNNMNMNSSLDTPPAGIESREARADRAADYMAAIFDQRIETLNDLQVALCEAMTIVSSTAEAEGLCALGKILWTPTTLSLPGNEDLPMEQNGNPVVVKGFDKQAFRDALFADPDLRD